MERRPPDLLGLSIRQPWAELILRGIKTIEIRRLPFHRRETIYVYATREFSDLPGTREALERHDLPIENLPRGIVAGTVEIIDCREAVTDDSATACVPAKLLEGRYSWVLGNPRRFDPPLVPWNLPYGMWFRPFGHRRAKPHRRGKS